MVSSLVTLRRGLVAGAMVASMAATALPASAGTSPGTLTVTATVLGACIISNATLAFGGYDPTATTALNGSTSVTVTCTKGVGTSVGLGVGSNASGTQRQMIDTTSGDTPLQYNLFQPTSNTPGAACAYTAAWGDGTSATSGTTFAIGTAPGITGRTYNVCGTIPVGQNVAVNTTYKDTVLEIVNF